LLCVYVFLLLYYLLLLVISISIKLAILIFSFFFLSFHLFPAIFLSISISILLSFAFIFCSLSSMLLFPLFLYFCYSLLCIATRQAISLCLLRRSMHLFFFICSRPVNKCIPPLFMFFLPLSHSATILPLIICRSPFTAVFLFYLPAIFSLLLFFVFAYI
jgi:hypothetical protein